MTKGTHKTAEKETQSLLPGAEIDIDKVNKQVEKHFRHGINPVPAILLALATICLLTTFILSPAQQVMRQYYSQPESATCILKSIFPPLLPNNEYPRLYHTVRKISTATALATPFLAAAGLFFHIRTRGKGFKHIKPRRRKKNGAKNR
jgi:hypothetical protein